MHHIICEVSLHYMKTAATNVMVDLQQCSEESAADTCWCINTKHVFHKVNQNIVIAATKPVCAAPQRSEARRIYVNVLRKKTAMLIFIV